MNVSTAPVGAETSRFRISSTPGVDMSRDARALQVSGESAPLRFPWLSRSSQLLEEAAGLGPSLFIKAPRLGYQLSSQA
jgi:hypothetical protein